MSQDARFFDVPRSRPWVLTRRIAHSAHHRGQLTTSAIAGTLPVLDRPTADTGGLAQQGATVIYRYDSVAGLLAAERAGGAELHTLPGPGTAAPTERPGD